MKTFTQGKTPPDLIRRQCLGQCPDGFYMTIKDPNEWRIIAHIWNQGIDAHLEALTTRSSADHKTGKIIIHPEELPCFLRRLYENVPDSDWEVAVDLRTAILICLGIEEI